MPCQPGGREGCPPNRWPQSHSSPGRRYFFANSWRLEELDSFPGKFREKLSSATNQSSNHKANTGLKKYSRGKQRPCVAAPSPAWLQRGITMADTQHPKQYLGIRGVTKIFLRLDRCHTPSLPAWRPNLITRFKSLTQHIQYHPTFGTNPSKGRISSCQYLSISFSLWSWHSILLFGKTTTKSFTWQFLYFYFWLWCMPLADQSQMLTWLPPKSSSCL